MLVTYRISSFFFLSHRKTTRGGERQKNTLLLERTSVSELSWSSWTQNKEKNKRNSNNNVPLPGHAPFPWPLLSIISSDPHSSPLCMSTRITRAPLHASSHEHGTFCFLPLEKEAVKIYLHLTDKKTKSQRVQCYSYSAHISQGAVVPTLCDHNGPFLMSRITSELPLQPNSN